MPASETREAVISLPIDGPAVIERFEAVERLSEPFVISVLVRCDEVVDFFPHLGAPVAITVNRSGEAVRAFHGLLSEADYVDEATSGYRYHLTLRPWLHNLSRNLDYAIFQEKSALDIIKAVFESRGCSDADYSKLSGAFDTREYCVQYRESDFNFVSRLMEEEGIYYFFRHEDARHVLVLCNARGSHVESEYSSLPFISPTGGAQNYDARLWQWNERVATGVEGQVKLRNFDFKQPDAPLEGAYLQGERIATEQAEIYDYPAAFLETDLGVTRGQMILQSARRQRRLYLGEGDAVALACGLLMTLDGHPVDRLNQEYLIAGLRYSLDSQQYRSGAAASGSASQVSLEAVPADTPWRAPMVTPRPVARGPETAVVTGPDGEVIYTDEFGRVKVRFHWDRSGSPPEKSTCFIRVSHNSAGAGFGNIILPRLGQEVIVDFLDGDPDRPMVTGRVYNAKRKQTYDLPANKTRSVWRSETVGKTGDDYDGAESPPGGSEAGKNEIRMEDASGKEELYVHAQRDRTTEVRRDDSFKLGRDQTRRVGRDRKTAIKNNETLTVEQGDETHTVQTGKRVTTIQQDDNLTVNQGNMATDVSMGNYSLKTDMGSVTVEAMQQIELKVGGNSIVIDQMGVTIKGTMISAQAQVSLEAKGTMTDLEGSAMTTIKGGVVMIN